MDNKSFLLTIKNTFQLHLNSSVKSDEKLKALYGFVAKTLSEKLGSNYKIISFDLEKDDERTVKGRYFDKKCDIVISKGDETIAVVSTKFIMGNYSQNSNNYFENMLGETANIRSNNIEYFQILILIQNTPRFSKQGNILKFEKIKKNDLIKHVQLSKDNIKYYMHSPDKTLIYIVETKSVNTKLIGKNKECFRKYHSKHSEFKTTTIKGVFFDKNIILNDFEQFIRKIIHKILSV